MVLHEQGLRGGSFGVRALGAHGNLDLTGDGVSIIPAPIVGEVVWSCRLRAEDRQCRGRCAFVRAHQVYWLYMVFEDALEGRPTRSR